MRLAGRTFVQRVAVVIMTMAAVAFALQGMFVTASEAATGDTSHYYLGFVFNEPHDGNHTNVVAHRHVDGIAHQHAVDDDDDALASHIKTPGWNMALVVCIMPGFASPVISEISSIMAFENPRPFWVADLRGLRRPPRPPGIV